MGYYRILGVGAQAPEPIVKIVTTAAEAVTSCQTLRRLCGRIGTVEVWGKDGRGIGHARMERLAQIELAENLAVRATPQDSLVITAT